MYIKAAEASIVGEKGKAEENENENDIQLLIEEHDMFLDDLEQEPTTSHENAAMMTSMIGKIIISNKVPYQPKTKWPKQQLKKQQT